MNSLIQKVLDEKLLLEGEQFQELAMAILTIPDDAKFIRAIRDFVLPHKDPKFVDHYRMLLTVFGSPEGNAPGSIAKRAVVVTNHVREQIKRLAAEMPEDETPEDQLGRVIQAISLAKPYGVPIPKHIVDPIFYKMPAGECHVAALAAFTDYNNSAGQRWP